MNTQDVPVARPEPAWSAPSPQATLQAELPAAGRLPGSGRADAPAADADVVVPYGDNHATTRGLPIFDDVELRWSRDGREASGPVGLSAAPGPAASGPAVGGPAGTLPRRPSPAAQGTRTIPGVPSGTPGRQGWTAPAEEGNPGGPDES